MEHNRFAVHIAPEGRVCLPFMRQIERCFAMKANLMSAVPGCIRPEEGGARSETTLYHHARLTFHSVRMDPYAPGAYGAELPFDLPLARRNA